MGIFKIYFVGLLVFLVFKADLRAETAPTAESAPTSTTTTTSNVPEFLFGPEFTFGVHTDGSMLTDNVKAAHELLVRALAHLIDGQPEGSKFTYQYGRLISPNQWWMNIALDPGVVEIQMKPMTLAEFKKYADDIQDALFVSAQNIGLFPGLFVGGGHINIGLKEFEKNPLLLRNFVMDFINHNELSLGILNYDRTNATSFDLAMYTARNAFLAAIKSFDYNFNSMTPDQAELKTKEFITLLRLHGRFMAALCFRNALESDPNQSRLEIRSVRPQTSIKTWIHQIELFQKRLEYLSQFTKPIPYNPQLNLLATAFDDKYLLNPPVDPQKALEAFYIYVNESGLKWENHREYIWPNWIRDGEREKFENSSWFKNRNNCNGLLQKAA